MTTLVSLVPIWHRMSLLHSHWKEPSFKSLKWRGVFDLRREFKKYLLNEGTNSHHTPFMLWHRLFVGWLLASAFLSILTFFYYVCLFNLQSPSGVASEGKAQNSVKRPPKPWLRVMVNKGWQIVNICHLGSCISFYFT